MVADAVDAGADAVAGAVMSPGRAFPGPQNSPSATASTAIRQHHCVRDTATGLSGRGQRVVSCPKWYVL
ncbi:hypothetical protein GCM10015535_64220 [Streptomyces gelaticus]|uniref:Uncharacterized protein n=1 Tax=Streptomyces gelaticus TaxID=285446 RepID=A0ABQ2WAR9_9ACTN|nr:hypothetical protein GCM10015535_64220 [Streptomyces gelaticus]